MIALARIALALFLFLPLSASAEMEASVYLTPEYPSPHQSVVLTLSSYSFDPNVATITWKANGNTLLSGLGAKRLTLTTGEVGQVIPITVTAVLADGTSISKSTVVTPQSVDLLYEGKESYVPPFYEGRSLPGEGSAVRIAAFPSLSDGGTKLPSSNLSFNWYLNGEFLERASGLGRSSVTLALDYLSDATEVRVLVRTPRGNAAEKTMSIRPHAVLPTLYKYDEVLGTDFSSAFFRRMEITKDATISLEPFYLSTRNGLEQTAGYAWYLDGLPVTPQEKTILSLRPKANTSGVRTLRVTVENTKRALQQAKEELEIIFDTRSQ